MAKQIKVNPKVCQSCKYHMGFGSQPNSDRPINNNVCCNYLEIMGHSRIFTDGVMQMDPKYCDKYEKGEQLVKRDFANFTIVESDIDEFRDYKICRVKAERVGKKNGRYYNKPK